jgi:hypothetical protein
MSIENAIKEVSANLGVSSDDLQKLIMFESGFNPSAKNQYTGARGLIQFMPDTARAMGYKDADEIVKKFPSAEAQLKGPVLSYLSKYKPFSTKQSLYMSVFYPQYRNVPIDTAFSDSIRKVNPGINFVSDYINLVEKRTGKAVSFPRKPFSFFGFIIPLGTITLVTSLYLTHKKESDAWIRKTIRMKKY